MWQLHFVAARVLKAFAVSSTGVLTSSAGLSGQSAVQPQPDQQPAAARCKATDPRSQGHGASHAAADAPPQKRQRLQDGSAAASPAAEAHQPAGQRSPAAAGSPCSRASAQHPVSEPQLHAADVEPAANAVGGPASEAAAQQLTQQQADPDTAAGTAADVAGSASPAPAWPHVDPAAGGKHTAAAASPSPPDSHGSADAAVPARPQQQVAPPGTSVAAGRQQAEAADAAEVQQTPVQRQDGLTPTDRTADRQREAEAPAAPLHNSRKAQAVSQAASQPVAGQPKLVQQQAAASAAATARSGSPAEPCAGSRDMLRDGITDEDVHLHLDEVCDNLHELSVRGSENCCCCFLAYNRACYTACASVPAESGSLRPTAPCAAQCRTHLMRQQPWRQTSRTSSGRSPGCSAALRRCRQPRCLDGRPATSAPWALRLSAWATLCSWPAPSAAWMPLMLTCALRATGWVPSFAA